MQCLDNWHVFPLLYFGLIKKPHVWFKIKSGLKIKIPGFPLGLYLVKDATILNSNDAGFKFNDGSSLFDFSEDGTGFWNGVNLVLSISTSLF
jgi:outer membrane protein insertion porin family